MSKRINITLAVLSVSTALFIVFISIWQFKGLTNSFCNAVMLSFSIVPALLSCLAILDKGKISKACTVLVFAGFITGLIGLCTMMFDDRPSDTVYGIEPIIAFLPAILYVGVMLVDICGKKSEKKEALYITCRLLHYDILIYFVLFEFWEFNVSRFALFSVIAMALAGNEISAFAHQQKKKTIKNVFYGISLAFAIPPLVIFFRGYWGEISRDGMFAIMLIFMIIMFVFNVINTYNNYKKLSVKNLER